MKIFLFDRRAVGQRITHDTHAAFVIIADDEACARQIIDDEITLFGGTISDWDAVPAKVLGDAAVGAEEGIVCTDFFEA